MWKAFVLVSVWCLVSTWGYGQILNIEKSRLDSLSREKPYQVKLEANIDFYNRSATNDEKAEFFSTEAALNATYAPGAQAYLLIGEINYVENNSNNILNNGNLHFRTTFNHRKTFSTEVYVQGQYDNFRGLTDRVLVGIAERWKVIENEKFDWHVAAGPMFEYERWRTPDGEEIKQKRLPKLSSYLTLRWKISDQMDFNTILYYQVGYDKEAELTRHRVSNTTNLNFKINDKLSFHTGISIAYDDEPIVPITEFIYSVENGISLDF